MRTASILITSLAACALLDGCALQDIRRDQSAAVDQTSVLVRNGPTLHDVVQFSDDAWLMGERVPTSKPVPAIYDIPVNYNFPARSIDEFARWVAQVANVRVVVDPSAAEAKATTSFGTPAATAVMPPLPLNLGAGQPPFLAPLPPLSTATGTGNAGAAAGARPRPYQGTLGGLIKREAARYGVWDKYQDGVITLFKTETRMFTLPALKDATELESTITTSSGNDSGSGGSGSGSGGSSSSSGGSGDNGGNTQKSKLTAKIEPLKSLEATANAIAMGGKVIADPDLGYLVVTGTPPQCDAVEAFVKSLDAMFGKIIALDVRLYSVELTRGENYGLDVALAYKSATGHTSAGITGAPSPAISGGGTGLSFGANVLSGPFAGSKGAMKLLSSLGNVTSVLTLGGAGQNGKKTTIQNGEKQGYLPSTQSTLAANVGATTSAQASFFTTGFTGQFLPKLTNGAIAMDMTLTLTRLVSMDILPPGCTGSGCTFTPHTKNYDLQSSMPLKPGESLLLVGMQQDGVSTTNNGVGSPFMFALGGGIDASQQHTLLAIVVTARVQ